MGNKKKWIFNVVFLLLITALTLYSILRGENPVLLLQLLDKADCRFWILGAALIIPFVACESLIMFLLLKNVGAQPNPGHCLIYSFIGFFFSSITPAAGGGQPAQVYYMHKDGLNPGTTTPILIVITIGYKLVLVIAGVVLFAMKPDILSLVDDSGILWASIGWSVNVLAVVFFFLLIARPLFVEKVCLGILQFFEGHFKHVKLARIREKLEHSIASYRNVAACIKENQHLIVFVIAISIVQRAIMFSITWLVLCSFHIANIPTLFEVILMQSMVSLGTDLIPLPGGSGAHEALFLLLFTGLCGEELVLPVLIASRGISYYGQLIICGLMNLLFVRRLGRKKIGETI